MTNARCQTASKRSDPESEGGSLSDNKPEVTGDPHLPAAVEERLRMLEEYAAAVTNRDSR